MYTSYINILAERFSLLQASFTSNLFASGDDRVTLTEVAHGQKIDGMVLP